MGAAGHRLSLATVYRKLQQLAAEGVIDQAHAEGRETLYRVCGEEGHHHHVVCRTCGDSAPVTGPDFEAWAERVASEAGFIDVDHNLQITGLCRKCQA
jgi:Fur family ferric uptake transcriptional regulator